MNKPNEEPRTGESIYDELLSMDGMSDELVSAPARDTVSSLDDEDSPSPVLDESKDYKFVVSKSSSHHHSGSRSHHHSGSGHHHHRHHHRHHHHGKKKKGMKTWKRVLLIVISVILLIAITATGIIIYLINTGRGELYDVNLNVVVPESVGAEVKDKGDLITYDGHTYQYDHDITSILFMGIDKRDLEEESEEGTGGQADVIVMIAINAKKHKTTLIALPRDTMTEVALYTPSGHYAGMQTMQVCMAYAYGDGKGSSCDNTVSSVRRILYNVPVKTYYALDLDGIAAVNDSVGGVDVVSPETIAEFVEGQQYHLMGKQAEHFVRERDKSSFESSMMRLERQKVYANGFISTMLSSIKSNITNAIRVFNESAPYSYTNLNAAKVAYLAKEVAFGGGMKIEMVTVPGKVTNDGTYAQYIVDEKALFEQFLSIYYEKVI